MQIIFQYHLLKLESDTAGQCPSIQGSDQLYSAYQFYAGLMACKTHPLNRIIWQLLH